MSQFSDDLAKFFARRGTGAAGWFNDLIQDRGAEKMKSVTLLEGINGWATAGKQYEEHMEGFVSKVWPKSGLASFCSSVVLAAISK